MRTAVLPGPQLPYESHSTAQPEAWAFPGGAVFQAQALETLSHAVEYLIDCGMFHQDSYDPQSNQAAVQILMRASRNVFENSPEVLPLRRRSALWSRRIPAATLRPSVPPAC